MQTLFTTEADQAAKELGMILRRRKIAGAGFVRTPGQELGAEIGIPALTASLEVADSCPGDDLDSLISQADAALNEAKQRGRNRAYVSLHRPKTEPGRNSVQDSTHPRWNGGSGR